MKSAPVGCLHQKLMFWLYNKLALNKTTPENEKVVLNDTSFKCLLYKLCYLMGSLLL